MLASSLPTKIQLPFANSGTKNTIPVASQIGITPGAASYTDGFPPLTFLPLASGGVPPDGADVNGILNAITAVHQWQCAGGIFKYDSAFSTAIGGYPAGAILQSTNGHRQFLNTADNNTTDPNAAGAGWRDISMLNIATAVAGGTANAITGTYVPAPTALYDGKTYFVRAASVNTSATVTFTPNSGTITAYPVLKFTSAALDIGDINGAGHWLELKWDATLSSWLLQNPAKGPINYIGVIGDARNVSMIVAAASATATLTADEVVVQTTLGGKSHKLSSFSQSINLATTGAGGMDTGSAPINGYVALYAIYNPTTGSTALLARDTTSIVATEVYGGANMPAGYTESALVSVWPTNASSQFVIGDQTDRSVGIVEKSVLSTSVQQASPASLSISSAVPPNAKTVNLTGRIASTAISANVLNVYATSVATSRSGLVTSIAGGTSDIYGPMTTKIKTAQTIYYVATATAGTMTAALAVNNYTF